MKPWLKIPLIAGGAAILGSLAGGLVGFAAAKLGPDLFQWALSSPDLWKVGVPTFLGAAAGGMMGGGLAGAILALLMLIRWWKGRMDASQT